LVHTFDWCDMPKVKKPVESESESDEEEESEESGEEEEAPPPPKTKKDSKATASSAPAEEEPKKPAEPPKPFSVEFVPHHAMPPMEAAVEVVYCPIDGLPADFCQYGPSWEKSKPWCLEKFPKYYPELAGVNLDEAKKDAAAAVEKGKDKMLPGGKKKRDASPHIFIKKLSRGGRKCVTCVAGMETFGVKLEPMAKLFKKKFSCGVAVVKGENGAPETVDIQGDFEDEVVELILSEYKDIPRSKFTINRDGGTKKKGKPK